MIRGCLGSMEEKRKRTAPAWLLNKFWFRRSTAKKRDFARWLRKNPTPPERILWERLRGKKLGVRFRRQAPILGWIVDFWCPSRFLVVEVDGAEHDLTKKEDEYRDRILCQRAGILTLRFPAKNVVEDLDHVVTEIKRFVELRKIK